jgi:hypothetical protein
MACVDVSKEGIEKTSAAVAGSALRLPKGTTLNTRTPHRFSYPYTICGSSAGNDARPGLRGLLNEHDSGGCHDQSTSTVWGSSSR